MGPLKEQRKKGWWAKGESIRHSQKKGTGNGVIEARRECAAKRGGKAPPEPKKRGTHQKREVITRARGPGIWGKNRGPGKCPNTTIRKKRGGEDTGGRGGTGNRP